MCRYRYGTIDENLLKLGNKETEEDKHKRKQNQNQEGTLKTGYRFKSLFRFPLKLVANSKSTKYSSAIFKL